MTFPAAVLRTAAGLATLAAAAGAAACASAGGTPDIPAPLGPRLSQQFRHDRVAPAQSSLSVIGTDVLHFDPDRPVYDLVARQWPTTFRPLIPPLRDEVDPRGA